MYDDRGDIFRSIAGAVVDETGAGMTIAIQLHRWTDPARFQPGDLAGVEVTAAGLAFARPTGELERADPRTGVSTRYETASWTSLPVSDPFAAGELIPSWTADTPGGSAIRVELRGVTEAGEQTRWYQLGDWAADDSAFTRSSIAGQADAHGEVDADTFRAAPGQALTSWALRITLLRPIGAADRPVLRTLTAAASAPRPAPAAAVPAANRSPAFGVVLDVPPMSQKRHVGEYPQWGGGGASWCSPTCVAMLLAYWGAGPTADELAWVDTSCPAPQVAHAARHTYDLAFDGCGNWPFNTAYAGRYGLTAYVTRLRSLAEAERFVAAGIPLIVSASFRAGQVPGLDYDTRGHLMTLVGFTVDGDPVLNDPNGATDADVRHPVGRVEFERAWLDASQGVVYLLHPPSTPLPPAPPQANW
jgi:hypothetical protein